MHIIDKISIIVPVYNVDKYLKRCIESILNQTYKNFELILVNDGSTDNSANICDEYQYKDKRVHTFHNKHKGVSYSRNFGISKCLGKYICFIDSDDWIETNYLQTFFKFGNQDYQFVSQGIIFDDTKKTWPFFKYKDTYANNDPSIFTQNKIFENGCPVAKLFCRKIIETNHIVFPTNISFHEDHVFVLRYLKYVDQLYLTSDCNYHYMKMGEITLSTNRKHSISELCLASELTIKETDALIYKWNNSFDSHFKKNLYYNLSQHFIFEALQEAILPIEKNDFLSLKMISNQLLKRPISIKSCLFLYSILINANLTVYLLRFRRILRKIFNK